MYNGAFVPIDGTSLEGWVVHNGSTCYEGYLQKGTQRINKNGSVTSVYDSVSPTTLCSIVNGTEGENSWYRSNVEVTLSAQDNSGGTGVKLLQYRIDGGTWQTVNGSSTTFTVSGDGGHYVEYHAQDNAGNWEIIKEKRIPIDTTAPDGSFEINNGSPTTVSSLVTLNLDVTDNLSGVWQAHFRNAGGTWSEWQDFSSFVPWLLSTTPINGQTYTIEAQFRDRAGNLSSVTSKTITLDIYPSHSASAHYQLLKSTWGAAAQTSTSTQYQIQGTLGQPVIGSQQSPSYHLTIGYWAPLLAVEPSSLGLPIIGDWDGNGKDDIGIVVDANGRFTYVMYSPTTEQSWSVSYPIGIPIIGDWDGDGKDDIGVVVEVNGKARYLMYSPTTGQSWKVTYPIGTPIIGDWDGDGKDDIGVVVEVNGKAVYLMYSPTTGQSWRASYPPWRSN